MTDFQTNLQRIFSRLNTFQGIFISTFAAIAAAFVIYSIALERKGEERLREIYDLRNDHDHFEDMQQDFKMLLNDVYLNTLKYLSEGKDIHLYQSVEDLSEINGIYNNFFVASRKIGNEFIPKTIQLKNSLSQFEKALLAKLNEKKPISDLDIQPIISDQDTLKQNVSQWVSQETDTLQQATSRETAPVIDMKLLEDQKKAIEAQLFELNALLKSRIDNAAQQEITRSIGTSGVTFLFLTALVILLVISFLLLKKLLSQKINALSEQLQTIATGELPKNLNRYNDVFDGTVENSNAIINYLGDSSKFALKIGEGDFNYKFQPKSEKDELGNALVQMRTRLLEVANEDKIRNWINEGQAKFGDILRNTGDDFEELGNKIVSNLVEYLNANQGVLYVKEESSNEQVQLNLLSAYAFKRKKHLERKIEIGEGLIGQAYQERKTVFLKEVKTDHFNIVTGLGESKPSSVLIVPLKDEEDIEGVIEIASFEIFKNYQIKFVEKLGESIASSIKTGKTNNTTKQLLAEMQTREEEMKAQEEELKQNMEELSATQEQLERLRQEDESRKEELEAKRAMLYDILDSAGAMIYLKDDADKFIYVNQLFAESVGKSVDDIMNAEAEKVLDPQVAALRKALEKRALDENSAIHGEGGEKEEITVAPFHINYLEKTGILGIIKP